VLGSRRHRSGDCSRCGCRTAEDLAPQPGHRVVLCIDDTLFQRMMALSVMWIDSGQTSVQHLVMVAEPNAEILGDELSTVQCVERVHLELGETHEKAWSGIRRLLSSWSRMTWQTFWHKKHSMHL